MNVARVFPAKHVRQSLSRHRWPAFDQQEGGFMVTSRVALAGAMRLDPDEMTHRTKPALLPRGHEALDPRPTVKRNTEAVGLEHALQLLKRRDKPAPLAVVGATPP